jgi:hypothetical protein
MPPRTSFLLLSALAYVVSRCDGLASSPKTANSLLSKLPNPLKKKPEPKPEKSLLEQLDLVEKSQPKTFAFKASQIPDLLTASFPVSEVLLCDGSL